MNDIRLLDCTLRDGGYVNDWNFGHDNLVSIFERLVDANVDMIEIGFLMSADPLISTAVLCRIRTALPVFTENWTENRRWWWV